jgi:hypothetical protein
MYVDAPWKVAADVLATTFKTDKLPSKAPVTLTRLQPGRAQRVGYGVVLAAACLRV